MRVKAIVWSFGPNVIRPPRSSGRGVGSPPETGTWNKRFCDGFQFMRRDMNTMFFESGVQVTTMLSGPQRVGARATTSE